MEAIPATPPYPPATESKADSGAAERDDVAEPMDADGFGLDEEVVVEKRLDRRLTISHMQLEHFKSYGPETVIGPFHSSLSAVVGPNGSGKSNVIDALLFVFGKKAKKLRLKKVSELIHKSSAYPDLDAAKVEVHFRDVRDLDDGTVEVIEGSELVVSRVAYKNNTSKYFINHKTSNYKGVTTLLGTRGIDLVNNRFLILQGEVEELSQKPPKARGPHDDGLLEYLEDVCGSNKYVEPIEAADKEVEELNEKRLSEFKKTKACETEKNSAQAAAAEALVFVRLERAIATNKWTLAQLQRILEEGGITDEVERRQVLTDQLAGYTAALEAKTKTADAVEKRFSAAKKETEAATKEATALRTEFAGLEKEDIKMRETMKHKVSGNKKHASLKTREQKKVSAEQEKREELESSIPTLEAALEKAQADKEKAEEAVEAVLESTMGETTHLRESVAEREAELEPWSAKLADATAQVDTLRTSIQLFEDRMQATQKEREGLEKLQQEVEASHEKQTAEVDAQTSMIADSQARLTAAQGELEAVNADIVEKQAELKASRSVWEERHQAHSSGASQSKLVLSLMSATKRGGALAGVGLYGRLGNLGSISKAYDTAITTACPALNSFVVQDTRAAQAVVDYVRTIGGRVRCIILDEIKGDLERKMAPIADLPVGTQRLFDLVESDERFRVAFYFALRDTLVSDNLDTATAAAYGPGGESSRARWRVVTKQGEMIDTSGAMSGGGRPRKGGMGSSVATGEVVSAEEVEEAKRLCEVHSEELKVLRGKASDISAEIKMLTTSIPKMELGLSKLTMGIESCEKRMKEITARMEELEGRTEPTTADKKQFSSMMKQLKEFEKTQEAAGEQVEQLNAEITKLQKKVLDAGGARLKKAKTKAEKAGEKLSGIEKELTTARVSIKASVKAEEKAQKAVAKAEKDIAKAKEVLEELKTNAKALEEKALDLNEQIKEKEAIVEAKTKEQYTVKKEFDELMKSVEQIRDKEVDATHALETINRSIQDAELRIASFKDKAAAAENEFNATLFADEGDDAAAAGKKKSKSKKAAKKGAKVKGGLRRRGRGAAESESESEDDDEADDADMDADVPEAKVEPVGDGHEPQEAKVEEGEGEGEGEGEEDEDSELGEKLPRELPSLEELDVEELDMKDLQRTIKTLETQREELKGSVNMSSIAEYRKKVQEHKNRRNELEKVSAARDSARRTYERLRKMRLNQFMSAFGVITMKLKEMYQMITLGGDAELELVDSLDPFSEGIVFSVRPPNKSWKNISNLSGGEKTLSSLALVFALHHYKPTPLYVMDEIDAALDFKNVSIIANYIKERTKNAQFVIISLRNNMFELADRLIGIYKTHDVTKSVAINPKEFSVAGGGSSSAPGAPPAASRTAGRKSRRGGAARPALADRSNTLDITTISEAADEEDE